MSVDTTNDFAEFLSSRRARITPEQAALPTYGKRRVPGLRREEVASLAGVSIDYYRRLERGNVSGVSDSVLEALARALQLDDAEHAHLYDLARAANPVAPKRRRPVQQRVRPVVQRVLDSVGLSDLVGELATRSAEFRTRWAAHNVRFHRTGAKRIHHPLVGDLDLSYETMELSADSGLTMTIYTADADSASQQALDLLASWAATPDPAEITGG
jgi:transcriptional regulator with XRE-family HTH domain